MADEQVIAESSKMTEDTPSAAEIAGARARATIEAFLAAKVAAPPLVEKNQTILTCVLAGTLEELGGVKLGTLVNTKATDPCRIRVDMCYDTRHQSYIAVTARFPIHEKPLRKDKHFFRQQIVIYPESPTYRHTLERVSEKPDELHDDTKVDTMIQHNSLWRLNLHYDPSKTETRHLNERANFKHSLSQNQAYFFERLTSSGSLCIYFHKPGERIAKNFDMLMDRFAEDRKHEPFSEYKSRNPEYQDKYMLEWGIACGPEVDREPPLPQTYYRNIAQYALTFGYREMREADVEFDAVVYSLQTPLFLCFVPATASKPGDKINLFTAHGNGPDNPMIRNLLREGSKGVLTFEESPNPNVMPKECWPYTVIATRSQRVDFGDLTLLVRRAPGVTYDPLTIDSPEPDMLEQSTTRLFLCPDVNDTAPKRLVDCAARLLYPSRDTNLDRLQTIRKFLLATDHSPEFVSDMLFQPDTLPASEIPRVVKLLNSLNWTQREALKYITHSPHLFKLLEGSAEAGKSTFLAALMGVCKAFNYPALFCAPSNAAVDELVERMRFWDSAQEDPAKKIDVIRYHNQGLESDMIIWMHQRFHAAVAATPLPISKKLAGSSKTPTKLVPSSVRSSRKLATYKCPATTSKSPGATTDSDELTEGRREWRKYLHGTQPFKSVSGEASPALGHTRLKAGGLWRHALQHVGIVDQNGDLNTDFVRHFAKGMTRGQCDDSRDQAFLDIFLDPHATIESKFKKKASDHPYAEDEEPEPEQPSLRSVSRQLMVRTLLDHPFVLSTTSNAAAPLLRQTIAARIVAIDEDLQDKELATLLPVMHNVNSIKSVILVGDLEQLGPIVKTRFKKNASTRKPINIFANAMAKSVFKRMYDCNYPIFQLDEQHRTVAN